MLLAHLIRNGIIHIRNSNLAWKKKDKILLKKMKSGRVYWSIFGKKCKGTTNGNKAGPVEA